MSPSEAKTHTDRVLQKARAGLPASADDWVVGSWQRCLHDYQLHPDRMRLPRMDTRSELEQRRAAHADVLECARHEMATLYEQLADPDCAVVLTDLGGVILHMVASPEFAEAAGRLGMRPGAHWAESDIGTNGLGTCLAEGKPVSVRGDEHFFCELTNLTCSAVPVQDPSGRITAVLDVSSRSTLAQQHVLVVLGMTARMIENQLLEARFRHAHMLSFHTRPEFVNTLHEGRLAVDAEGRILAANRSALFQLGVDSVDSVRGTRIDAIFADPLKVLLERSVNASFHPVATYRANAAMRFFAVTRRPASEAGVAVSKPGARALPVSPVASARAEATSIDECALFQDPRLAAALATAQRVIARATPVLLCAETGAGKEVFARAVHRTSPHGGGQFVAVNCASLPESLIESELFGYRAGAFTGAQRSGRRGKILQADGGTLFLDEIADMPLELQARLLRVLDERQVTPLGTEDVHPVNFQLLAASHRHLPTLVAEGRFREDLYYRLAGIELALPPLRDRTDKAELIENLLMQESGGSARLSQEAADLMLAHPWPGNVRQLRHVLRTAVALSIDGLITTAHLPGLTGLPLAATLPLAPNLPAAAASTPPTMPGAVATPPSTLPWQRPAPHAAAADAPIGTPAVPDAVPEPTGPPLNPIQANERRVLLQFLEQHRWNVSHVAKALGVSRSTLYRKLHKLQIPVST